MSKRWIAMGALLLIGAYWAVVRTLQLTGLDDVTGNNTGFVAHALGAFVAGAVISMLAPVRPAREPLAATLLGVAWIAVMFLALPHPTFSWIAARTSAPWAVAGAIAAGSAVCAIAGAVIGRMRSLAVTGPVIIGVMSFFVLLGTVVTICMTVVGLGLALNTLVGIIAVVAMWFAGYLAQSVLRVERPWAVGLGTIGCVLFQIDPNGHPLRWQVVPGLLMLVLITRWGARVAWRRMVRSNPTLAGSQVPSAVVQGS